jgi:uncharacterized protein with PQ loop repeat
MDDESGKQNESDSTRTSIERILPAVSVVTMLMTLPQVLTVWTAHDVGGVSLLSWGTYLVAACLWFVHGLQKRDKTIYVACIGWILLNAAVVAGVLVHRAGLT